MKKLRRILALSLALTMGFMAVACDQDDAKGDSDIPALFTEGYDGFPIVEDTLELKFMNQQTELQADFNQIWFFKALEEASNIKITFENVPSASAAERRNLAVLAEEQPDAYFKMGFPTTDVAKYSADGLFVPIDGYFDEIMPNFSAVLERRPDVRVGLTMPDGHLYSTAYILDHYAITAGTRYWFNGDALEDIGKDVPETIDELTEVLRLLQDQDLNGNGVADEVLTSSSIDGIVTPLLGSWGLGNRGSANIVDMGPDDEIRFLYTTDEYREVLEYLAMLYDEGILDPDIFTSTTAELVAKGTELRAPVYSFVNHSIIGAEGVKSKPMTKPFTGPHGDEIWRNTGTALSGTGSFLITNQNEHVEETLKWIDFMYSDAGVRNYFMGIEGENYESEAPATFYIDEDGNAEYNKFVMENTEGLMFEEVLGSVVPWAGGGNPSIANEDYFKGGEMQSITRVAADNLRPYMVENIWPGLVWEADEVDDMSRITADINTHHTESRAAFIAGTTEINDDTWAAFIEGFDNVGLERYMEIYQNAIDRYELN